MEEFIRFVIWRNNRRQCKASTLFFSFEHQSENNENNIWQISCLLLGLAIMFFPAILIDMFSTSIWWIGPSFLWGSKIMC